MASPIELQIVGPDGKVRSDVHVGTLLSGERQAIDAMAVIDEYGYEIVSRTTTDTPVGTTGAPGDYCSHLIVVASPTVADLEVTDGGTSIGIIVPTTAAIGDRIEVGHMCANNFTIESNATGVGTVKFVGRFT